MSTHARTPRSATSAPTARAGHRLGQSYGNLPATEFTTGTDLNLSDGFALFPRLGTIRALKQYRQTGVPLAHYGNTLDQFMLVFNADLMEFYGIAGPSYVVDVQTTGDSDWVSTSGETHADVEIAGSRFAAGIEAGFTVGADINCVLVNNSTGGTLVQMSPNVAIDVVNLLVQLIEVAMDDEGDPSPLSKLDNLTNNGVLSSWGIYDSTDNAFADGSDGTELTTTLHPTFTLPINIVPLLDGIPVVDVIPALDAALAEVDGGFSFGPALVFGIPVTIQVANVQLDGQTLPAWDYNNEQDLPVASFGPADFMLTSPPTSFGMTFEHTVSFSFGVGFFANIQAAKVFNLPYNSPTVDLLELFHITAPTFGPYDNTLTYSTANGKPEPRNPTTAPVVRVWMQKQPYGIWKGGVLGQYAVTFTNGSYETGLGPWSPADPHSDKYALGSLVNVPTDPTGLATGRNVYRTFGDGTNTLVGTIPDNTTTTFIDNNY